MKVIVLGHNGFVGSHLFEMFQKYVDVTGYSSKDLNLLNKPSLAKLEKELNPDTTLIYCSAVPRAKADDYQTMMSNITMAENMAAILCRQKISQCIYLSSIDVYGRPEGVLSELSRTYPVGYYGCAKLISEILLGKALREAGSNATVLRLGGIYGPGEKWKSPISCMLEGAVTHKKVTIYGDGSDLRDYMWVGDLCSVVKTFADKNVGGTFNVATGSSLSILGVARIVKGLMDDDVEIVMEGRKREPLNYQFDIGKLKQAVGSIDWIGPNQGIRQLYERTYM